MTFAEENVKRLERGIVQCQEVIDAKRRLGGDASDKELADDKRIARQVKHRLEVALPDWSTEGWHETSPDGSGMRMLWPEWWAEWQERAGELVERAENRSQQHAINRELEGLSHVFAEHRS